MEFEVDPAIVLGLLRQRAQQEPLLAAWLDAATWQAVALQQSHTEDETVPKEDDA